MPKIQPIQLQLKGGGLATIREAEPGDAQSLSSLDQAAASHPTPSADRTAIAIARSAADPQRLLLVAVVDGRTVGRLRFIAPSREATRHRGRFGILVAPPFRSRGIGSTLIGALLQWATDHPVLEKVRLGVAGSNAAAIRLYQRHGFVEEARRRGEIRLAGGGLVDDVWMALWVKGGSTSAVRTEDG